MNENGDTSQNTAKSFASQWLSMQCIRKFGTDGTGMPAKFSVEIPVYSQRKIRSIRSSYYRTMGKGNAFGENSSVWMNPMTAGIGQTSPGRVERKERCFSRTSL